MTMLPSGGPQGPVPEWPFDGVTPRQAHWWVDLWENQPQAAMWAKLDLHHAVARYCVALALFERGSLAPQVWAECRQMEDRLGLNPIAMLRLRWDVTADEVAERRERPAKNRPEAVDRVVEG